MADPNLGTAVLHTRLDKSGLSAGLNTAKQETEKFAKDTTQQIRGVGAAIGAIAASQGLRVFVNFFKETAVEANQAATATALFEKAIRRNNESVTEGAAMVQRLSERFGVVNSTIQDSATTMLRQGASVQVVEKALLTAGASAAAAGADIATAFQNVSTAVVSGNSVLLRSSGIIAGLGEAERAYAQSVGKTVDQLTQQEKIQARVNAIYAETSSEIEDLDQILKGLPRAQAEVTKQTKLFRETAGDLALKVITPITEGLGTMLRWFNSLPEPVKQAGVAMAGAATGATALATGIIAIRSAMSGLSALGLLSFGPAGWIVLGITAVAGLAAALSSRGDSLTTAFGDTRKAIASGNKDSMIGAFDELIAQVKGPVSETLKGLRDELRTTGDVGVEQARRMLTELAMAQMDARRSFLGLSLFGPTPLGDALATGGALLGNLNLQDQVRRALDNNELITAIDLLQDAIVAMTQSGLDPRRSQPLVDFLAQVGSIPNFQFTPTPTPAPTALLGGSPVSEGAAREAVQRTVADVFADLGRAGTEAMRRAAFEGDTPEALRDAARTRVGLYDRAISELMSDPLFGQVSAGQWAYLLEGRARAFAETLDEAITTALGPLGVMGAAGAAGDAARLLQRAQNDRIKVSREDAAAMERALDLRARLMTERGTATLDGLNLAILQGASVIGPEGEAAVQEAMTRPVDALRVNLDAAGGVLGEFAGHAGVFARAVRDAADQAAFAESLTTLSTRQRGVFGRGSDFAVRPPQLDAAAADARVAVRNAVAAYDAGRITLAQLESAIDGITEVTPMTVRELDQLGASLWRLREAARIQEFDESPGSGPLKPRPLGITPVAEIIGAPRDLGFTPPPATFGGKSWADYDRQRREEQAAADQFRDTVIRAGVDFATGVKGLFESIASGDTTSAIKAGFNIFGDLGATLLPGFGPLIKFGTGLMGDLFSSLFGGGGSRDVERRREQEAARARSVPAINISFTVDMTNNYNGAPRDPANEQAFARQADALFESIYRRHLGPRLDRIEQRLGIAGA